MISKLKDTLLLVGDRFSDRAMLHDIFESSFNLLEAEGIPQALMFLEQNSSCIAAVLADIPLDDEAQVRALSAACLSGSDLEIPLLLFISPSGTGEREEYAFLLGATDVVLKPYTRTSIQRRIRIIVDVFLHKWSLEKMVAEQSATIRNTNQVMLDALSAIIEHRSTESGNHVLRIRRFTQILLENVAEFCPEYGLTRDLIDIISGAAALHDIGKISVPDAILNKPGKLTAEEFEIMKSHAAVGSQLIEHLAGIGDDEYLRYAYNISLYHHERWDGRGYPAGLKEDAIPICAQVVGLADVYDALTTPRVYKDAFSHEQAVNMILNGECGAFSPKLLACFKNVRGSFMELAHRYADGYSPKSDKIAVPLPGPSWKKQELTTLELVQIKYQALLHYINELVVEMDLDEDVYHVVYNAHSELEGMLPTASFREIVAHLKLMDLHPDDRGTVDDMYHFVSVEMFRLRLHRKSFRFRIYDSALQDYPCYELTFLRLNTGDSNHRRVIAIWHKQTEKQNALIPAPVDNRFSATALMGILGGILCCEPHREATIRYGSRDMYTLTGYTEKEILKNFGSSLLSLIVPEDRDAFSYSMDELVRRGGTAEMEFRIQRKLGKPLWVLDRARLHTEPDGTEFIYHVLSDISRVKNVQRALEQTIERNQIIIDQSGGIVFEWDLLTDTMVCSPKWDERFGYPPVSENYGMLFGTATHFHPDDLLVVRSGIQALHEGSDSVAFDVRIANIHGRYLWNEILAAARRDENGKLVRIIGIIKDNDELKRAAMSLQAQAEQDSLTHLLNKAATQQQVGAHLSESDGSDLSAMLLLDLDNFKNANDSYGHLYGDAVLTEIGSNLRKLFRSHDVIGRIGGDEFLVFMQDIPNEEMVHNRCKLLLATFRDLLSRGMPDLQLSVSIGAAMFPAHGKTYQELFLNADKALYAAKSRGKNRYTFYDPKKMEKALSVPINTRIDSDEQPGLADHSFLHHAFHTLYQSADTEAAVTSLLETIGKQVNVSRVYIFENNEDNTACSNTFEWCNEGIPPEKAYLQDVSYITDIAGWPEVFDENGVFYCTDITQLEPRFREILEPQGIKSMLQCAIMDNGVFRGYVGFDECSRNRSWSKAHLTLLRFLSELLALSLLKKRSKDKAQRSIENLQSILDSQDAWIYVIDPESHEIRYLNEKCRRTVPGIRVGAHCHEAFIGEAGPCKNCPAAGIAQGKSGRSVIYSNVLGENTLCRATPITWNGEAACLLTCYPLEGEDS